MDIRGSRHTALYYDEFPDVQRYATGEKPELYLASLRSVSRETMLGLWSSVRLSEPVRRFALYLYGLCVRSTAVRRLRNRKHNGSSK